jgi:hypothetical protein
MNAFMSASIFVGNLLLGGILALYFYAWLRGK